MFAMILLNASYGNGHVPSNYGWNLYADVSHRLWWIKSLSLFAIMHHLWIEKNQI